LATLPLGLFLILVGGVLYFWPTIGAYRRGHNNVGAIFALNLLLGWTFIGWIIALIWGWTDNVKNKPPQVVYVANQVEVKPVRISHPPMIEAVPVEPHTPLGRSDSGGAGQRGPGLYPFAAASSSGALTLHSGIGGQISAGVDSTIGGHNQKM
jgi:hypothetical protein